MPSGAGSRRCSCSPLRRRSFTAFVEQGERVTRGQKLLEFDVAAISAAGYCVDTPVIVTNSDDFAKVECVAAGAVGRLGELLHLTR